MVYITTIGENEGWGESQNKERGIDSQGAKVQPSEKVVPNNLLHIKVNIVNNVFHISKLFLKVN